MIKTIDKSVAMSLVERYEQAQQIERQRVEERDRAIDELEQPIKAIREELRAIREEMGQYLDSTNLKSEVAGDYRITRTVSPPHFSKTTIEQARELNATKWKEEKDVDALSLLYKQGREIPGVFVTKSVKVGKK